MSFSLFQRAVLFGAALSCFGVPAAAVGAGTEQAADPVRRPAGTHAVAGGRGPHRQSSLRAQAGRSDDSIQPMQVAAVTDRVTERLLRDVRGAVQDSTAVSPQEQAKTGVGASALGSSWTEVRVVPANDRLLGSIGGWRQRLSRAGFDFTLSYMAEGVANVAGGRRTGFDYSHQVVMGTDFDLNKLFGMQGWSFHMLGVQRAGRSVATDYLGQTGLIQPQQDYGVGGNVLYKLVYMYLEKTLFDKKLTIDFGRMPANLKYGTSYFGCYALNSVICAHPTGLSVGSKWRSWPFSQWGMTARLNPGHGLYAQAGFFEASATEGGRAGFNFSFKPLGYVVPVELGWEPALGHDRLTGHYKIGGYIDTSNHPDPFTAFDGSPILISHKAARIERQRGAWYVGADQMVVRFGAAKDQGLILFGMAGWDQGASLPGQSQYTLGIISQGMFPSRVTDAISLFWSWQNVNRKITRYQEMQQDLGYTTLRGGLKLPQSNFQVLELTYTAFITRGLKLLPDLQYIVHPDANRTYPNALEAGFRLLAQF
ncbi:carbohydrate porin [Gluconacetobacter liquefaciens]|uniref:Carbohydrate porin n=2 Tax=Gluconacetobacter liquefaciens TaxID=89584 RepID=A0A7W4PAG1_GLULI|nr:carbohydrate porin [Gluconacetobacter liquefaciens]MBB2187032.1 carbohydrate porin [Gluconacetobacter liquefaciens]